MPSLIQVFGLLTLFCSVIRFSVGEPQLESSFSIYTNYSSSSLVSQFSAIDCSADGKYVTAVSLQGVVYSSINYGDTNFRPVYLSSIQFKDVAVSASGQFILVVGNPYVTHSANYGNTFSQPIGALGYPWTACASSDDGSINYIVTSSSTTNAQVYISTDYGASFDAVTNTPRDYFIDVVCNSTGQAVYVLTASEVYFSTNSGVTWKTTKPGSYLTAITVDATG
jgi:photosystem II stability/assembly factor-like uncharacterized protein